MTLNIPRLLAPLLVAVLLLFQALPVRTAHGQTPPFIKVDSRFDFLATLKNLKAAVSRNRLGIVNRASAQQGAAAIGVKIPGNQVWGLFAPRFAVRMLKASVAAGYEAPIRLYIVEAPDGRVTVRYRKPSVVFKPYGHPALDAMAKELDTLFAKVVASIR